MENKTLSRSLFGVTVVLFIVSFYFFWGMMANGAPESFDPEQMGLELYQNKEATADNYLELGEAAYEAQLSKIDGNILGGVNYMTIVLFLAGGLMVVFLVWGLITTLMNNFKKGMPSLIFVGIAALAFIWAFINSGTDTTGFENVVKKEGLDNAQAMISSSNFWVNGLFFVLIPGAILLVVDLIIGIVKGYTK